MFAYIKKRFQFLKDYNPSLKVNISDLIFDYTIYKMSEINRNDEKSAQLNGEI